MLRREKKSTKAFSKLNKNKNKNSQLKSESQTKISSTKYCLIIKKKEGNYSNSQEAYDLICARWGDSSHMELNCLATGMNSCQNFKIESPDEQGGG